MKGVKRKLGNRGATFKNAFAVYPLCCPSRATLLTGQYPHNHGVLNNGGPDGGVNAFDESVTLATALEEAGYRTGYIGKYLNGYPALAREDPEAALPPGWNRWFGMVDAGQYEWSLNANGNIRRFGREPRDYQTDVLRKLGADFIRQRSGRNKPPFFLMLGTNAPARREGAQVRRPQPAPREAPRGQVRIPSRSRRPVVQRGRRLGQAAVPARPEDQGQGPPRAARPLPGAPREPAVRGRDGHGPARRAPPPERAAEHALHLHLGQRVFAGRASPGAQAVCSTRRAPRCRW